MEISSNLEYDLPAQQADAHARVAPLHPSSEPTASASVHRAQWPFVQRRKTKCWLLEPPQLPDLKQLCTCMPRVTD